MASEPETLYSRCGPPAGDLPGTRLSRPHLICQVLLHPAPVPGQIELLAEHGRGLCYGPTGPEGTQAPNFLELTRRWNMGLGGASTGAQS